MTELAFVFVQYLYWCNSRNIIPQHIASSAERASVIARMEEYMVGADKTVVGFGWGVEVKRPIEHSH